MTLREKQEKALDAILEQHDNGKNVILVAPNGFGKTYLASYLIARLDRVSYTTPTHLEIEHAKSIFESHGVTGVHMMSKDHLCSNDIVRLLNLRPADACPVIMDTCPIKKEKSCSYFNRRDEMETSKNIFLPHAYMLSEPELFTERTVIIDEIHQFVGRLTSEQTLPVKFLEYAKLLSIDVPRDPDLSDAKSILNDLAALDHHVVHEKSKELYARGRHYQITGISSVYNYAKMVRHGAKIFLNGDQISLILTNPSSIVPKTGVIGMTGSLTKISEKVLSDFIAIKVSGYEYDNLRVIIDTSSTTQSKYRSAETFKSDFNKILSMVKAVQDTHIVVLATSNTIAHQIYRFLIAYIRKTKLYHAIGSHEEVREKVKRFREDGGIMVSVLRGRITEGIDLPEATFMIIYGVPFLPLTDAVQFYIDKYGFGSFYTSSAIAAASQAIGRGIRDPKDKITAILLDKRYKRYQNHFPDYVRNKIEVH